MPVVRKEIKKARSAGEAVGCSISDEEGIEVPGRAGGVTRIQKGSLAWVRGVHAV